MASGVDDASVTFPTPFPDDTHMTLSVMVSSADNWAAIPLFVTSSSRYGFYMHTNKGSISANIMWYAYYSK